MQPDPRQVNPYATSNVTAQTEPGKPSTFRPLAIFVGWLADTVFSLATSLIFGIVVGAVFVAQGIRPENLQKMVEEADWIQLCGQAIGFVGTLLGSYIAAWMGKARPLLHAFGVGVASILTGLVGVALFPAAQPVWATVLGMLLALPAALLGGYLRSATATSKRQTRQGNKGG